MTTLDIAEICHEANRVYCESLGDDTQTLWEVAPEWQKESVIKGVQFHLDNPEALNVDSHNEWLKVKESEGWKYGKIKDVEKKEHPCMMPYSELPPEQQFKDKLFVGIIDILRDQVVPQVTEGKVA